MKKTICIVLCIASAMLLGCGKSGVSIMDDYRDFIESYEIYDVDSADDNNTGDNADEPMDDPDETETEFEFDVSGFSPIFKRAYDSVELFPGNIAVAYCGKNVFLIKQNREIPIDFILDPEFGEIDCINEYYVVSRGSQGKSIVNISVEKVGSAVYDDIKIISGVAFCYHDEYADIVINGSFVRQNISVNIIPITENYCIDTTTNLILSIPDLAVVRAGGFTLADAPDDGIAIVKNDNRLGYADVASDSVIIAPQYFAASPFSGGYAAVRLNSSTDYPVIINKEGHEIFDFGKYKDITAYNAREIKVLPCNNGFIMFEATHSNKAIYGCIDLTDPESPKLSFIPGTPLKERAFGKYAIIKEYNKLIDLTGSGDLIDLSADEIIPTNDGFIIKSNNSYSLIDYNLMKVASNVEYLNFNDGAYTVGYNGKYFICSK